MKIQEFLDSIGVETPLSELRLDGTLNYLKESGGFNGWYRGYINKFGTFLQFGDWREKESFKFKEDPQIPADQKEREVWEKERKKQQEEDAKLAIETQERVAKDSEKELTNFYTEGQSLYLSTKGVRGWGVHYRFPSKANAKETDLIVPVRDITNKLWGYQIISPYGDKDLLPGGKIGGCFHRLGPNFDSVVYIAEGYATAASVFEITGKTTLCAFNAGNIPKVAKAVRETYPKIRIIVAADNDETGISFAKIAAKESDAIVVSPSKNEGSADYNDLHQKYGKEAVRKLLVGTAVEPKNRAFLLTADEILDEPEEDIDYVVDGLLPKGGTSVIAGQPKVGKTTLVRDLLRCVSSGRNFLNRKVRRGKAIYYALEEKKAFLRSKLKKFSKEEKENLHFSFKISQENRLDELRKIIDEKKPDLVVIDTLYKFIRVKEETYGEMVDVLTPIEEMAKESGAHIVLVHHAKKGDSKGVESVLGSTAIAGSVDTIITIKKQQIEGIEERILASSNRYGEDIDESVYSYDRETEVTSIRKAPTKEDSIKDKILNFYKEQEDKWLSPSEVREQIGGSFNKIKEACIELNKEGALQFKSGDRGGPLYCASQKWVGKVDKDDEF